MESKSFLVTARKYRPQHFKDVVGQSHITKTLMNAINQNRIHHAYLFNGPRGVGKTTTARIFARAVNCLNLRDGEPCNECEICKNSLDGRSMDIIEIDGASNNSVDDIRKLRENVKFPPVQGRFKMYIIDEVHMLSTSAFNALLKTLEEPPEHLLFVFATTEPHKVPPTIMSRCQRFDFRRMEIKDITEQLKQIADAEKIVIDEQSLYTIAKKGDGSMRDSESIFDQVVAFSGNEITYHKLSDALHLIDEDFYFEITYAIANSNLKVMFDLASKVIKRGYDYIETLQGLLEHCRNLLAIKITNEITHLETSLAQQNQYLEHSKLFEESDLIRMIQFISSSEQVLKYSPQQKVRFELILAQLAYMPKSSNINELIDLIKNSGKLAADFSQEKKLSESSKSNLSDSNSKISTIASEQINVNKEIHIDIVADDSLKNATSNTNLSFQNKVISKEVLKEKWNEFLDNYANNQNQLTSLSQLKVEFEENVISIIFPSEVIYNNYNSKVAKENLVNLIEQFFDTKLKINYILDSSLGENQVLTIKEKNIDYDFSNNEQKESLNIKSKDTGSTEKSVISKVTETELSDVEKSIVDLFNAKKSNF